MSQVISDQRRRSITEVRVIEGRKVSQRLVNQGVGEVHIEGGHAVTGWWVKTVKRRKMRIMEKIQVLRGLALETHR